MPSVVAPEGEELGPDNRDDAALPAVESPGIEGCWRSLRPAPLTTLTS
jgi:hypothetical protein